MWNRTKRLINSYLDNLIDKVEQPEREVQSAGAVKTSHLGANAAETLATVKLFEKQIAQLELKITGLETRLGTVTNDTQRMLLQSQLETAQAELLDLRQRLGQARAAAAEARRARDTHPGQVRETVNNAHLAAMGETAAGANVPTSANDPAWVMDEMRAKIERRGQLTTDAKVAAADAELENPQSAVDALLAQYKQEDSSTPPPTSPPTQPEPKIQKGEDPPKGGGKSLGSAGEVKSLD